MVVNMLTLRTDLIPDRLQHIPDPPKSLLYRGAEPSAFESKPALAIVGSRKVSSYGRLVTERLSNELAALGIVIVSGLALGIDSIAHQAAIQAGGTTIAVVPGGVDFVYPYSNRSVAERIITSGGSIISELCDKQLPIKAQFLVRNRLVSGLADAVLITEAAERSGSLNTASHALTQGKTVFAVPGNITSGLSAGTNNLIKAGAIPVTCAQDILSEMGWGSVKSDDNLASFSPDEQKLIRLIGNGCSSGEELLIRSGLTASSYTETMTMLELSGVIKAVGGNQWMRR